MVSFSHFLILFFPLALFLIFLYRWHRDHALVTATKRPPPSPRKLPVIGNLHQLGLFPHRSFQSLSIKHGPLMLMHFGRVPVLVVSSADAAREIMKTNDLVFSNRPKITIADKLFYGSKDVAFAPYGEHWRHMRSICVLQLLSVKRVQSFRRVREEETSLMIENIRQSGSSVVNLSDLLMFLTNDIVCRVALGRKYSNGEEGKMFKKLFKDILQVFATPYIGDFIPWLSWIDRASGLDAKVKKLATQFDEFLESVVEERRSKRPERANDENSTNFVDILLEIQRESKDSNPFENDALKAIILDMFAAGTDTTYSLLEWTMAELLRNPITMEKLQQEMRQVVGGKEEITENDLEKMQYLKAVIKESLRLRSPVPLLLPRELTQDTKVMGYDIAAGTQVYTNAWSIARDPSLWENPEEFHPERFLDSSIDFRGQHFELIPFGAGRRGCPGVSFAIAVNELALAKLVHNFDFALPNGERNEDLDMTEASSHKKNPMLLIATPCTC